MLHRLLTFVFLSPWLASLCFAAEARVVSLLPSHSEIAVALGAGDRLIAVSDGEDPTAFPTLPRIGGLPPRWETLMSLRPTLILADSAHERFRSDFERFRLPVVFLPSTRATSVSDVFSLIQKVGDLLDKKTEAQVLLKTLRDRLIILDAAKKPTTAPTAFFEIWPRPLQAVGGASLQGDLLRRAGFNNIVPDTVQEMPLMSPEWVVKQNPDYIFYTSESRRDDILRRPGWGRLSALRTGRLMALDGDLFSRAGPRVLDALETLFELRERTAP